MIQNRIRQKHKINIEWVDIVVILCFGLVLSLIYGAAEAHRYVSALVIPLVINVLLLCALYALYLHFYSINQRCGKLTDEFVASARSKTNVNEIKDMIVRYNSDYYYSYDTFFDGCSNAHCKLLDDVVFGYSKDDNDNVLDKDSEYILEKGAVLQIPDGYIFQALSGTNYAQLVVKSNNSSKCFKASGSYRKVNGRRKLLNAVPVKIKTGARVQLMTGTYEGLCNFKNQEGNLCVRYPVEKHENIVCTLT